MKYEELENERLEAEEQAIGEPTTDEMLESINRYNRAKENGTLDKEFPIIGKIFVPSHELSNDEQDNYAAVE